MPRLLYVSYTPFGVELADMCSAPMLEMVSLLLTSVTGFGDSLIFCHMVVPPMTISTSQKAGPGRILSPLCGFMSFSGTPSVSSSLYWRARSSGCQSVHQLRKVF